MDNPWTMTKPFEAMFTDVVEISGARPRGCSFRGSFTSCVYPVEDDEPFSETDAETSLKRITLLVIKRGSLGWNKSYPPQIGDQVVLENGSKWKVSNVDDRLDWFEVRAKSC